MSVPALLSATARRRAFQLPAASSRAFAAAKPASVANNGLASKCFVRGYRPAVVTAGQRRAFTQTTQRRLATPDDSFDPSTFEREVDEVDVCIVGGGPAGLSAAIRLKQLANEAGNEDFRVLLLEKAGELGDHIVSGNVIEPSAIE